MIHSCLTCTFHFPEIQQQVTSSKAELRKFGKRSIRKPRILFSQAQVQELEQRFKQQKYLCAAGKNFYYLSSKHGAVAIPDIADPCELLVFRNVVI